MPRTTVQYTVTMSVVRAARDTCFSFASPLPHHLIRTISREVQRTPLPLSNCPPTNTQDIVGSMMRLVGPTIASSLWEGRCELASESDVQLARGLEFSINKLSILL